MSSSSPTATSVTADTVERTRLLAPGTWKVDPGHAEVGFVGRHLRFAKVRGRFTGIDGAVVVAEEIERSEVLVVIDMATVSSGDAARDDHLRSDDLFDVATHPTATFRGTGIEVSGTSGRLHGELTIKGTTRPLTLEVEQLGLVTDPWGGERAVFSAHATIDREDWGLTWNMVLEAGGLLVSKEVRLEIEVELLREG